MTKYQCDVCSKPATQWMSDPWGKSGVTYPKCAEHGLRLRDPTDVAEIERLRAAIIRCRNDLRNGLMALCLERLETFTDETNAHEPSEQECRRAGPSEHAAGTGTGDTCAEARSSRREVTAHEPLPGNRTKAIAILNRRLAEEEDPELREALRLLRDGPPESRAELPPSHSLVALYAGCLCEWCKNERAKSALKSNQDGRQTPAPSGHAGLGTAGGASSLHQPSAGWSFEGDLARIEQIRRAHESARPVDANPAWKNSHHDCGFLLQFIDCLWREYSRQGLDADRYRWLRTNVNSGVTVLFDPKDGPYGKEGYDYNDEDCDIAIDRLMAAPAQKSNPGVVYETAALQSVINPQLSAKPKADK